MLALTLAGGGNRCFWQLGLLERWWPVLEPRLRAISACSAGASMAVTWLSGRQTETHRYWEGRRSEVTQNFDGLRLLRGRRPTPHEPIYRDTLRFALADGGLQRIRARRYPVLILAAAFPRLLPVPLATTLGMAAYLLERQLTYGRPHPKGGRRMGFAPVVVDARGAGTPEEVVNLVLASSATPPFTAIGRFRGRRLLDGGVVDNAPAFAAEGVAGVERTVVLLTRPYPRQAVGRQGRRLYLCPTEPVPINRWDYTSAERVEATVALGRRDAERHGAALLRFIEATAIDD